MAKQHIHAFLQVAQRQAHRIQITQLVQHGRHGLLIALQNAPGAGAIAGAQFRDMQRRNRAEAGQYLTREVARAIRARQRWVGRGMAIGLHFFIERGLQHGLHPRQRLGTHLLLQGAIQFRLKAMPPNPLDLIGNFGNAGHGGHLLAVCDPTMLPDCAKTS